MYRSKTYRERSFDEIKLDLDKSFSFYQSIGQVPDKIFLCDGDALGAPMELLTKTLDYLNSLFPEIRRIGIYATAENILVKTEDELKLLASKKLTMAYLGLESGDDKVLHMIVKGNTAEDMVKASQKIKACGFKLSTIAMLGVGGQKHSSNHIINTAKVLSKTAPHFFSFLTTFSVPGTPYDKMLQRGLITRLTSKELFKEMHDIIELSSFDVNPVIFRANHVSNMVPLGGIFPKDKEEVLRTLKQWIEKCPEGVYPKTPTRM